MAKKKHRKAAGSSGKPTLPRAAEKNFSQSIPNPPPAAKDQFLGWLGLAGIVALSFLMSFHTLIDTDIFWHLKTGQIIFETHRVPHQDLYSFTIVGKEWIDSQWLFQLIVYSLYRFSGYPGMIVFGAMLTAITWALLIVPNFNSKKYLSALAAGLIALLAASARFRLRPEILSFCYIAMEIFLLGQFRRGKKWALYPLPLLLLLWVNSEGLWPIYFVILSVFLFEELLGVTGFRITRYVQRLSPLSPKKSAMGLGITLGVSIPPAFLNPYGYRGVIFPAILFQEAALPGNALGKMVQDLFNPFTHLPWFDRAAFLALLIFSTLFLANLLYRRRIYPAATMLWLAFLLLSISAVRNVALFAIVTAGLFLPILAQNQDLELFPFPALGRRLSRLRFPAAAIMLSIIILLAAGIVTSRFFSWNRTFARFGIGALETEYPIRAGQYLKDILTERGKLTPLKIFPDVSASGYLIWIGSPEWKVYADPRLEVYGEAFLLTHAQAMGDALAFAKEDRKYDFDAVVVGSFPIVSNLILSLYHDPKWALIYLDGTDVVFLKDKPGLRPVIEKYRIDFKKGFYSPIPRDLTGAWLASERSERGFLLNMLGQLQWALPDFEAAVELEPENPEHNYDLGWTLNMVGRFSEALPYLEKAASREPEMAAYQIQLARACAMTGQVNRAEDLYLQILQRNPLEIKACTDLANFYEQMKEDRGRALEQWLKCRQIYLADPKASRFAGEISSAFDRLGNKK